MNSSTIEQDNQSKFHPTKLTFKQAVAYRQKEFPRERVYQIFSPKRAQDYANHEVAFRINGIEQKLNLMISNLPIEERTKMQKYNILCSSDMYLDMLNAPKYVFDVYHFNYTQNTKHGPKVYSKTFYYMVAPTLFDENNKTLPVLYRMGITRDLSERDHFSFSIYAVAGGYEDGFFFLGRLDNDVLSKAHLKKIKKPIIKSEQPLQKANSPHQFNSQKVPFPHFHRPRLYNEPSVTREELDRRESSEPYHLDELVGADFDRCLEAFLESFSISPTILLAESNCKITEIIQFTKNKLLLEKLKTHSASELQSELQNNTITQPPHSKVSAHDFLKYAYCIDFNKGLYTPIKEQKCGTPYLRI